MCLGLRHAAFLIWVRHGRVDRALSLITLLMSEWTACFQSPGSSLHVQPFHVHDMVVCSCSTA